MSVQIVCLSGRSLDKEPSIALVVGTQIYIFEAPDNLLRNFETGFKKPNRTKGLFTTRLYPYSCCISILYNDNYLLKDICKVMGPSNLQYLNEHLTFGGGQCELMDIYKDDKIEVEKVKLSNSLSFIVSITEYISFDSSKAIKLGVKPDQLKDLKNNKNVILSDGTTVTPQMVHEKLWESFKILMLDATSLEDLDLLENLEQFKYIVHFSDSDLVMQPEYQQKFTKSTNICFQSQQDHIYQSDSVYSMFADLTGSPQNALEQESPIPDGFFNLRQNDKFFIYPNSNTIAPSSSTYEIQPPIEGTPPPVNSITILGSFAKSSDKFRNITGYLLNTPYGYMLFDSGAGTTMQIYRKFGHKLGNHIISQIKWISVSHQHLDHISGLSYMLSTRSKLNSEKVIIFSTNRVLRYIKELDSFFYPVNATLIPFSDTEIDQMKFKFQPVTHRCQCFATRVEYDDYSFVFSGDRDATKLPIDSLGPCDILLHEATYINDPRAYERGHSNLHDAVAAAKSIGARKLLMTHFSKKERSDKIKTDDENALPVIDFMTVPLKISDEEFKNYKSKIAECWESIIPKKKSSSNKK